MSPGKDAARRPDAASVRAHLREQSRIRWGYLVFLWVICLVVFWLLARFLLTGDWPWPFILLWASLMTGIEAWNQHRRSSRLQHVRDKEPVLVEITRLDPRKVTVRGRAGEVSQAVSSTGGLTVGDRIWAAPAPTPGIASALVPHEFRLGSLHVLLPQGPAEPATPAR